MAFTKEGGKVINFGCMIPQQPRFVGTDDQNQEIEMRLLWR